MSKTILVVDDNGRFLEDLRIIGTSPYRNKSIQLELLDDSNRLEEAITRTKPDLIVISARCLAAKELSEGIDNLIVYSRSSEEEEQINVPYERIGVIYYAMDLYEDLVNKIDTGKKEENKFKRIPESEVVDETEKREKGLPFLKSKKEKEIETLVEEKRKNIAPAKVYSVYSAKGGVGKTTIACELATFLAIAEKGPTRPKVCIADFDKEYGDVKDQLMYDPRKVNMLDWANDIKEHLNNGENPDEINYTAKDIEGFLQKNETTGLYALIAPITPSDGVNIDEIQMDIMLRNLTKNGEFDYIIIDTGNNLRDESYLPMTYSDNVFLVMTQLFVAISDCYMFLGTMAEIGYDTSKFRLIINQARSQKETGIGVDEIITKLTNGRDAAGKIIFNLSECFAEIPQTPEATKACNEGVPMVISNPTNEFSKAIAIMGSKIMNKAFELLEKKKSFLERLFKKDR